MIIDKVAPHQRPAHADAHPGELRYSIADIGAATRALGYQPTRDLRNELDSVIAELRTRRAGL
jgi:hypothetical protein